MNRSQLGRKQGGRGSSLSQAPITICRRVWRQGRSQQFLQLEEAGTAGQLSIGKKVWTWEEKLAGARGLHSKDTGGGVDFERAESHQKASRKMT